VVQVIGAIAAAGTLYLIASGKPGFDASASGFASNGYGAHCHPRSMRSITCGVLQVVV